MSAIGEVMGGTWVRHYESCGALHGSACNERCSSTVDAARKEIAERYEEVRRLREENQHLRQAEEEMRDDLNGILDGIYGGVDTEYSIEYEAGMLADLAKSRLKLSEYGRVSAQQRAEIDRLRAKVAAGERLAEAAEPIARQGGVPQDEDFCHVGITTKEKCGRCSRQQALIESLAAYREAGKDGTR